LFPGDFPNYPNIHTSGNSSQENISFARAFELILARLLIEQLGERARSLVTPLILLLSAREVRESSCTETKVPLDTFASSIDRAISVELPPSFPRYPNRWSSS
jgi:hypothetical protein